MTLSAGTSYTYWSLLGLSPGSNAEELKQAFKREAKIWHPDVNTNSRNAEERFKWINEAYLVLSDPKKRFEWEIAGRPPFEIKEFSRRKPDTQPQGIRKKSENDDTSFNSAERILILLISSFTFFLLDIFLF